MVFVCVYAAGSMSALQRHQQHVQHILKQSYVTLADVDGGNAQGFFCCTSVKHPKTIKYAGCVGELLCECPQDLRDICKHLEAAAHLLPFTHDMRMQAAAALVGNLRAVDLDAGVLVCK